ncbi:hypothetical protein [Brevibacillus sp. LEMMJ03]|uniref:hypothetical protein n=1 Tax=Brevibacillus sp. LEMMJ03 TaxID=2595056 RepID=UPI00117CE6B2|nr:hypothetical protein [Brevibacillus sp. LEMMJ03]
MLIFLLLVVGCSDKNDQELIWFDTPDDAIQYGVQQEGITVSDILAREERDGESLIIYKIKLSEGTGLGVASLARENGKYAWYRADQPVLVQYSSTENTPVIKIVISTFTKKSFTIYLGSTKDPNKTINTDKGTVSPTINKNEGLLYYIE